MNIFEFLKFSIEEEHKSLNQILTNIKEEDLDTSIGDGQSIRTRFIHITEAEYRMATYLYSDKEDYEFKVDASSIDDIKNALEISKMRHLLTLSKLRIDDLQREWKSKVSGNAYSYKFLLYHFFEHIATHRGQISMALRLLKAED